MGDTRVYAPAASAAWNDELGETLARLARDVRDAIGRPFVALVLGGGYGRGEGAVTRKGGREAPYDDLDLFLVAERAGGRAALDALGRRYARERAVHVDVGGPWTLARVRCWTPRLRWFDLLQGHRVLAGPADLLAVHAPAALREHPPALEATRLLVNRGAGLLRALRVVRGFEPAPDTELVRRNAMKCALALGDAVLLAHGRYATPVSGRGQRLAILEASNPAVERLGLGAPYDAALRFELDPDSLSPVAPPLEALLDLARSWSAVLLHVESRRTGRSWETVGDYVAWEGPREEDETSPASWAAHLARNLRVGRLALTHPRERLYRELAPLLVEGPVAGPTWGPAGARLLEISSRFDA